MAYNLKNDDDDDDDGDEIKTNMEIVEEWYIFYSRPR
jgi:hypothetical protein